MRRPRSRGSGSAACGMLRTGPARHRTLGEAGAPSSKGGVLHPRCADSPSIDWNWHLYCCVCTITYRTLHPLFIQGLVLGWNCFTYTLQPRRECLYDV